VNLWTVFKHEFALYFISPIFYLVGGVYLFFAGLFFTALLVSFNQGLFFEEPALGGVLQTMVFLTMFFASAITMRVIADENRQGTMELLLTAPVRDWEIVVGKFLAAWAVVSVLIIIMLVYPFILTARSNADQGVMMSGYLGLWLLSGMMMGVGVLASSLTQYQLLAFFISLVTLLIQWVAWFLADLVEQLFAGVQATGVTVAGIVSQVLDHLTTPEHYSRMLTGLINWSDIAYFVGLTALCLFLATQRLQMRRWSA
jgi:ABC-2 type transport system permease protein